MCRIVGYIGQKETAQVLLDGLKELKSLGYDSAGITLLKNKNINTFKAVGKLVNLEKKVSSAVSGNYHLRIEHSRWATHGKLTELNAHPHLGEYSYVILNGIIEDHKELKEKLTQKGYRFVSQTDTEVIIHLFENFRNSLNDVKKCKS